MLKLTPVFITLTLFLLSCSDQKAKDSYQIDTASQNIVGGQIISHSSEIAKSIVFISTKDESNRPSICTGTFISSNTVLTAAHCIPKYNDDLFMTFRTSQYEKTFDQVSLVVTRTKQLTIDRYKRNDIALIEFSGGLPEGAKALKLFNKKFNKDTFQFSTVGFGKVTGDENADPMMTGENVLRKTHITGETNMSDNLIYIDQEQQKTGVCFGDSGAPGYVVDKKTKSLYIVGVASYVKQKDPSNKKADVCLQQSAFIKIAPYVDLINSELNLNFGSQLN